MTLGDETDDDMEILVEGDELAAIVQRLQHLLPSVTEHLKESNRLEERTAFFTLIANGSLDLSNIAIQLFWDVVRFHNNPFNEIHSMRFSKDVK